MRKSHDWNHSAAVFDDKNLVSCAGLVPVMELAEQSGLSDLLDEHVVFRCERIRSGAANPTPKLTSIIAGLDRAWGSPLYLRDHRWQRRWATE